MTAMHTKRYMQRTLDQTLDGLHSALAGH
jgi:hypothetical protein